jgi:hypothetical protein
MESEDTYLFYIFTIVVIINMISYLKLIYDTENIREFNTSEYESQIMSFS